MAGPGVIVACTLAGLLAGRFALVAAIEALPEPAPLLRWQRVTVVVLTAALWGWIGARLEAAPRFRAASLSAEVHPSPHGWGFVLPTLLLAAVLVAVAVIDLRTFRIPDRITFPALAASLVAITLGGAQALGRHDGFLHARNALIGMALYFAFLFIPHLVSPRGMGFGDVKLGLILGLYLGWFGTSLLDVVNLVLVGALIGCVLGIVLGLVVNAARRRRGAFPFGPALAAGTMAVVLLFDRFLTGL